MKHRNSHLLVGYWSRLRKGRDVPDQTDIDPRAIRTVVFCIHGGGYDKRYFHIEVPGRRDYSACSTRWSSAPPL